MAIVVTEEMVQAARRKLPARWSMQDLHDAIQAALEAAPPVELSFEHLAVMTDEVREQWAHELNELRIEPGEIITLPCLPSLIEPPSVAAVELGGVSEISDRLGVARSTVAGWTKRAEKIGMPAPLAELAAGPVYNLAEIEAWYRQWKDQSGPGGDSDAAA